MSPYIIIAAIGFLIVFVLLVQYWWREEGNKIAASERLERGLQKEQEARSLLKKWGYSIVAEQTEYKHELVVDGQLIAPPMRIDYMVERRGKRYVVEVKSGEKAITMWHAPTRRQILEYALVVPCDGVFLLDMESKRMSQIVFTSLNKKAGKNYWFYWLLFGFVAGISVAIVVYNHFAT